MGGYYGHVPTFDDRNFVLHAVINQYALIVFTYYEMRFFVILTYLYALK